jgi:ubiquinol-cytochrome c reductase iron-sulfur subunit
MVAVRQGEGRIRIVADQSMSEPNRRDFLFLATGAAGAVAVGGVAWPLISQMSPDASTIAAGAPVEVDLAPIAEGRAITLKWRGKPIFVRHRTAAEIEASKKDDKSGLPDPQPDAVRVRAFEGKAQEQWVVVYGNCTHLGCVPIGFSGDYNGWYCPCHGSHYDNAGRIRKGPAPRNLDIPEFAFLSASKIRIG